MIEGLADATVLMGIAPFVIPAILAGIDLVQRAAGAGDTAENANRIGQSQFDADIFRTTAGLIPEVGRQQQLDPVRNALISDLGGEFFPGVDSSVFENIRTAGPRPGVPDAPQFRGIKVPSFGRALLTGGVNPELLAGILAPPDSPSTLPTNSTFSGRNPDSLVPTGSLTRNDPTKAFG